MRDNNALLAHITQSKYPQVLFWRDDISCDDSRM